MPAHRRLPRGGSRSERCRGDLAVRGQRDDVAAGGGDAACAVATDEVGVSDGPVTSMQAATLAPSSSRPFHRSWTESGAHVSDVDLGAATEVVRELGDLAGAEVGEVDAVGVQAVHAGDVEHTVADHHATR